MAQSFHYQCSECKKSSKPIRSPTEYIRLLAGHSWVCSECIKGLKSSTTVQKLLNGHVVYNSQF
jgi:predicted SprT family Zn-dependent metalloprotease